MVATGSGLTTSEKRTLKQHPDVKVQYFAVPISQWR